MSSCRRAINIVTTNRDQPRRTNAVDRRLAFSLRLPVWACLGLHNPPGCLQRSRSLPTEETCICVAKLTLAFSLF